MKTDLGKSVFLFGLPFFDLPRAMYCLWMMEQGKVHTPPAWYTASLKHNWNAPHGMTSDWLPTVLHFRVDDDMFAQIEREMREEKRTATPGK